MPSRRSRLIRQAYNRPAEKEGDKLVHSERSYGVLSRSFSLPVGVDAQAARAEYRDGVLELTLPKRANAQTSRLAIQ